MLLQLLLRVGVLWMPHFMVVVLVLVIFVVLRVCQLRVDASVRVLRHSGTVGEGHRGGAIEGYRLSGPEICSAASAMSPRGAGTATRSAIPVVDVAFLEQIVPSLLVPVVYDLYVQVRNGDASVARLV